MILKHFGKIVNGKRLYYNVELHRETIFDLEGQEFEETIKLKHKKVSNDAFGYYYGAIVGEALKYELFGGWDKDDVDDFFSKKFLTYHKTVCLKHDNGVEEFHTIPKVESKGTGFTSKKMREFTEKCIQYLAEHNIIVQPSEAWHLGKYKTITIKK